MPFLPHRVFDLTKRDLWTRLSNIRNDFVVDVNGIHYQIAIRQAHDKLIRNAEKLIDSTAAAFRTLDSRKDLVGPLFWTIESLSSILLPTTFKTKPTESLRYVAFFK